MKQLVTLVEGPGDIAAVPLLLKKLFPLLGMVDWNIAPPIKVGQLSSLLRASTWDSQMGRLRVQAQYGKCHGVLVLLDLDDATACPVTEAQNLAARLAAESLPIPVAVVFARREYEEWLVASLPSIAPNTNLLPNNLRRDYAPEGKRGVKEWLAKHLLNRNYRETIHQAELTRHLDPTLAAECRSFRRLQSALAELAERAEWLPDTRYGQATPMRS
jgi:hypothetical protein